MLSLNKQQSPRTLSVHEKIALQCALKISKLAASLPKPRTLSGDLPIVVELRRADDNVLHRYQVNLPADYVDPEPQQLNPSDITALSQQLNLPCLVHDCNEANGLIAAAAPIENKPKLVMMLEAEHAVQDQATIEEIELGNNESITARQYSTSVCEAPEHIQDFFMTALHGQQSSSKQLEILPLNQGEELNVEQQWQSTYTHSENEYVMKSAFQSLNGYKLAAKPKQQKPLILPLNGYKKPSNWNTQRAGNSYQPPAMVAAATPQLTVIKQPLLPTPSTSTIRDNRDNRLKAWTIPNIQSQKYGFKEMQKLCGFMPRIDNYVQHVELQRELKLRQQRELELQQKKIIEQQNQLDTQLKLQVPQELQSLFQWENCRLCNTTLTSKRTALDHYLSKTHMRRVETWLIQKSFISGNQSPETFRHLRNSGPAKLHCDLCDLKLSSMLHALQHFCGRRHRLVERQISKPNGEGYYDNWGNWVRTNDKWLMCQLCDVIVTSESQLGLHMAGSRHRKREWSKSSANASSEIFDDTYIYRIAENGTLVPMNAYGNHSFAGRHKRDIPIPEDFSANFYCELCNLTLNHKKSAKQHVEGRGHCKKLERNTQFGIY